MSYPNGNMPNGNGAPAGWPYADGDGRGRPSYNNQPHGLPSSSSYNTTNQQQAGSRLAINTNVNGHNGHNNFFTPSPSDHVSPNSDNGAWHNQAAQQPSNGYGYQAPTPPEDLLQDHGDEFHGYDMNHPFFNPPVPDDQSRYPGMLSQENSDRLYAEQARAHATGRQPSVGSRGSNGYHMNTSRNDQDPFADADECGWSETQLAYRPRSRAPVMPSRPINHQMGFMPNHVLEEQSSRPSQANGFPSSFLFRFAQPSGYVNSYQSGGSSFGGSYAGGSSAGGNQLAYRPNPQQMSHQLNNATSTHGNPTANQWQQHNAGTNLHHPTINMADAHTQAYPMYPQPIAQPSYFGTGNAPFNAADMPANPPHHPYLPTMGNHPQAPGEHEDVALVRLRKAGMSYRDIKQYTGSSAAESTLRGRYRTLTKDKEDRVRKPVWTARDDALLKEALEAQLGAAKVAAISSEADLNRHSISWKEVGDYIFNHGGSYHFAPKTAKKRYIDVYCR